MKKIFLLTVVSLLAISNNNFAQGWQWLNTGYPYIIFDMCFPPGQSAVGYAVGSTLTSGGDGAILKTTDGGFTWTKISADTLPGLKTVCFTSINVGYVGGYQNCLIKTTDAGTSWNVEVIDSKLWYFNNIEFRTPDQGVAVSYPSSVYRTSDGGITWTPTFGLKHSVEDVCYADSSTLFLVGGDERIYKSTNAGFYWIEVDSGAVLRTYLGVEFFDSNFGIVTGEDGKVVVTTNGGTDWTVSNAGGYGLMRSAYIMSQSTAFVVGTPEQVYKSTNGGVTWLSDFNGSNTEALYKIIFTENNTGLICGSGGKFLINTDYVIPVELTEFKANVIGDDIHLEWSTKSELNNYGFEILRSTNNYNWDFVAFVPGSGTTTETREYSFKDEQIGVGDYFYKLKQVDFNGKYKFSDILTISVSIPEEFVLEQNYPNPFNPVTSIKFSLREDSENVRLFIYSSIGEKVIELVNSTLKAGKYQFEWDAGNVASGIYFYELRTDKFVSMKKMLLLR